MAWRARTTSGAAGCPVLSPEPFRADSGVETVPEPGTLPPLIGAGCMALAVWKRRSAFDADDTDRAKELGT